MTTLAVHTPMPLPSSLAEIHALSDSLCMAKYELAGSKAENDALKAENDALKAENDALKAERAQHKALLDSLLAERATNRTALVPAAAPPKPTAPDTNGFDASESESEDEEGHAEAHESEDTERESEDEEGPAATNGSDATERAQIGLAKPKATAKAGQAPLQSAVGKKAKAKKRKSAYNMYMATKCAKAKAAKEKIGEKFTREDSKEVFKGVAEKWKKTTEDCKAFYQTRADEANRDSGL